VRSAWHSKSKSMLARYASCFENMATDRSHSPMLASYAWRKSMNGTPVLTLDSDFTV